MHLPKLPATPGNEFVGEVLKTGKNVSNISPGDHVIAARPGIGTWRSHLITSHTLLEKVSKSLPIQFAATLLVNPCTAYRMLQDFVELKVGDTLIQNAANSAVGQMVIQLAKYKGVKTINIIRDREDFRKVQNLLEDLGANIVLSDKQIRLPREKAGIIQKFGKAKLALNAVGGKSVSDMSSYLETKGVVVTYGAMSREPNVIPAGKLIFMDHRYVGYWNTRWLEENGGSSEYKKMIEGISRMVVDERIVGPVMEEFKLESFKEAIERYFTPYTNQKQIYIL
ncbi:Trans-2-enoyl-CoA reductase, mitochondrial [Oopsacas minuta]|uniref:Enoyl-[acyl-carrier-protein] reductase, mitochondrial n=1 Tax=Oopsacas minuta TaxID=111878 RepID=A0AAV7KKL3_9METZ|nr:Trans-2-enoyl-CoA reductase, mitochondrial [Oopsacas minuta]